MNKKVLTTNLIASAITGITTGLIGIVLGHYVMKGDIRVLNNEQQNIKEEVRELKDIALEEMRKIGTQVIENTNELKNLDEDVTDLKKKLTKIDCIGSEKLMSTNELLINGTKIPLIVTNER